MIVKLQKYLIVGAEQEIDHFFDRAQEQFFHQVLLARADSVGLVAAG